MRWPPVGDVAFNLVAQIFQFGGKELVFFSQKLNRFSMLDGDCLQLIYKIFHVGNLRFQGDYSLFGFAVH